MATRQQRKDRLTDVVRTRLKALREANDYSNAAWARVAKQDPQDVNRFMQGKMTFPPLDFLESLCRVFHTSLAEVLAEATPSSTLTRAEQKWLQLYALLDAPDQQAFVRIGYGMVRHRGNGKANGGNL